MKCVTISIFNDKGGVAKTTTTIHLGEYLAKKGYNVLLIDLAAQCDLSFLTGAEEQEDVYDVKKFLTRDFDNIKFHKQSEESTLYIMKGSKSLGDIELTPFELKDGVKMLKKKFDFILIDCSSEIIPENKLTPNEIAMNYSDFVIIPINADCFSPRVIINFEASLIKIKKSTNPDLKILGILYTRVVESYVLFKEHQKELKNQIGDLLMDTVIHQSTDIIKAQDKQQTIFEYNPQNVVAEDYMRFGDEVIDRLTRLEQAKEAADKVLAETKKRVKAQKKQKQTGLINVSIKMSKEIKRYMWLTFGVIDNKFDLEEKTITYMFRFIIRNMIYIYMERYGELLYNESDLKYLSRRQTKGQEGVPFENTELFRKNRDTTSIRFSEEEKKLLDTLLCTYYIKEVKDKYPGVRYSLTVYVCQLIMFAHENYKKFKKVEF